MNDFDFNRKNDIEYLITYGVNVDFKKAQALAASAYNVSQSVISTPKELAKYLSDRYRNNLDILKVFNHIQMPKVETSDPYAKEFGETYVGQLIMELFGGGTSNVAPAPYYPPPTQELSTGQILAYMLGAFLLLALIIGTIYMISKKS